MTFLFITFHFPLTMALLLLLSISTVEYSHGRELRPAEHGGLTYEPDQSPEMSTFFGSTETTTSTAPSSTVPLPEARNISDASRQSGNGDGDGGGGGKKEDDARKVLLLASVVGGTAGVVLLLVSAFFFLFRRLRKEKVWDLKPSSASPLPLPPPPPPPRSGLKVSTSPPPPPITSAT